MNSNLEEKIRRAQSEARELFKNYVQQEATNFSFSYEERVESAVNNLK